MANTISNLVDKIKTILRMEKKEGLPSLAEEEKRLIEELKKARQKFNTADEDSVDLAIYELLAAEERLNLLIKKRKKKQ